MTLHRAPPLRSPERNVVMLPELELEANTSVLVSDTVRSVLCYDTRHHHPNISSDIQASILWGEQLMRYSSTGFSHLDNQPTETNNKDRQFMLSFSETLKNDEL